MTVGLFTRTQTTYPIDYQYCLKSGNRIVKNITTSTTLNSLNCSLKYDSASRELHIGYVAQSPTPL